MIRDIVYQQRICICDVLGSISDIWKRKRKKKLESDFFGKKYLRKDWCFVEVKDQF